MKKSQSILLVFIAAGVCLYAFAISFDEGASGPPPTFHATLADPSLYGPDGLYTETVDAPAGPHELRFVPNGDSPRTLTVELRGDSTSFLGTFELASTRQGTEAAEYYTWEYVGDATVSVGESGPLEVRIDPHGTTMGPVSVSLYPSEG